MTQLDAKTALAQLEERKRTAPEHIDQGTLPAGAPITYYCKSCGHVSCVLPETWVTGYKRLCDFCQRIKDEGII